MADRAAEPAAGTPPPAVSSGGGLLATAARGWADVPAFPGCSEPARWQAEADEGMECERSLLIATIDQLRAAAEAAVQRAEQAEEARQAALRQSFDPGLRDFISSEVRRAVRAAADQATAELRATAEEATAELRAAVAEARQLRPCGRAPLAERGAAPAVGTPPLPAGGPPGGRATEGHEGAGGAGADGREARGARLELGAAAVDEDADRERECALLVATIDALRAAAEDALRRAEEAEAARSAALAQSFGPGAAAPVPAGRAASPAAAVPALATPPCGQVDCAELLASARAEASDELLSPSEGQALGGVQVGLLRGIFLANLGALGASGATFWLGSQ
ncbi:unnamed protein product [Prorocentrum cordatum]|uniref:Uncharacterized protein n=1 Tax=Prorocentrum cordatum TaxID=2364126 RepID=A0ABN9XCJ1_9DINO|nr:unnamed protein product [Polarella glacialis]